MNIINNIERKPIEMVLFLCTGNFYRSRLAEEIFNEVSFSRGLPFEAFSRALSCDDYSSGKFGPISPFALDALRILNISPRGDKNWPKIATKNDFEISNYIVALHKEEHKPMVDKLFPDFSEQIIYWYSPDLNEMTQEKLVHLLHDNILQFFKHLSNHRL